MPNPDGTLICFESCDPKDIQMALDYWEIAPKDSKESWNEPVESLARRIGVTIPKLLLKIEKARLYNLERRCVECEVHAPEQFDRRSKFVDVVGKYVCQSCIQIRRKVEAESKIECERQVLELKREKLKTICAEERSFHYDDLTYGEIIIVYSLMLASEQACETGVLERISEINFVHSETLADELVGNLCSRGILSVSSLTSPDALYQLGNGEWTYHPSKIVWQFANDEGARSFPTLFTKLGKLIRDGGEYLDYAEAVSALWWSLGLDDALQYLLQSVEKYRFPPYRRGTKTNEALAHALQNFSIPQVRNLIYRCVKDAAALANKQGFSPLHALNTIPGDLIRKVDYAVDQQWNITPFTSGWDQESWLLRMLFDRALGSGLTGFRAVNGSNVALERKQ